MEIISFAKMCVAMLELVFDALHSKKGVQVSVDAQNLGRGAMIFRFAIAISLCLCL
jgi:hypothetical protein